MNTFFLSNRPRIWVLTAVLCGFSAFLWGQGPTLTISPNNALNSFHFKLENLAPLPRVGTSSDSHAAEYGVFLHFGDGNWVSTNVEPVSSKGTWETDYSYTVAGTFAPTVYLAYRYTPPTHPDKYRVVGTTPSGGTTISSTYSGLDNNGAKIPPIVPTNRAVGLITNNADKLDAKGGMSNLFGIGWNKTTQGQKNIRFFYGSKLTSTGLQSANLFSNSIQDGPVYGNTLRGQKAVSITGVDWTMINSKYQSVLRLDTLSSLNKEGRYFFSLTNLPAGLDTASIKTSFLVVLTSNNLADATDESVLNSFDTRASSLFTPGGNGKLKLGTDFVVDFAFLESLAAYIHDPNELRITSATLNGSTYDVRLDYQFCTDSLTNVDVNFATLYIDETANHLQNLQLLPKSEGSEAEGEPISGAMPSFAPLDPTKYTKGWKLGGFSINKNECVLLKLTGQLPAADEARLYQHGQILHACVVLQGELSKVTTDYCRENLPLVKPIEPPCDFWCQLKALCQKTPIFCWILFGLLVLLILYWLWKKMNS